MKELRQIAAICGLFCGTCPMFPIYCKGCLSDKHTEFCETCQHGFRECTKNKKITWCFECEEFPCERSEKFRDSHWENGVSHHESTIDNLKRMQEVGVEAWVKEAYYKSVCPHCERIIFWNQKECECQFEII